MHPHMVCDVDEAAELTSVPEKLTVIYPTSAAPIECLLWSTFSLLLRTKVKDYMEHFVVCINGPDKRTGDPTLQDKKQAFLEELRAMKWWNVATPKHKRDMPLTILRVWSRIGHPESVEMAVPWVHTDAYLIMHDDIIIDHHNWLREVEENFYSDPDVVIAYWDGGRLMCCQCDSSTHQDLPLLRFPHLLCAFLCCRKKHMKKLGSSWCGYHIPTEPFHLADRVNLQEFMQHYSDMRLLDNPPQIHDPYHFISMEMGAWHFARANELGLKFAPMNVNLIHFGAMSWEVDTGKANRIDRNKDVIKRLEEEIRAHPDYGPLYDKYLPEEYK